MKNLDWPNIDKNYFDDEEVNFVVQINGKKELF